MALVTASSGELAQAIDYVIDQRLSRLSIEIEFSFDPYRCRSDLLPWLAYHRGVDVWLSEWTVSQQRGVVASAVRNFRNRGTVSAIQDALGALASGVDVIEWWQEAATPGTFRVNVLGSGTTDIATQNAIADVVTRTAPYTRHSAVTVENAFTVSAQQVVAPRFATMVNLTSRFPMQRP